MKVDFGKPFLGQPHVVGAGAQVGQGVCGVAGHAHGVGVCKGFKFCRGVGSDPAGAGVLAAFHAHVAVVFAFEAVLHHLKLQLANGAQQHVAAHFGLEHLNGTFFSQLGQALLELFGAQRVFKHHGHKQLWRKKGQTGELQAHTAVGDGVAQLNAAVGGKAHNVSGIGLVHRLAPLAHKGHHRGGAQFFSGALHFELHAGVVAA